MKLPWRQLATLVLILSVSAAATGPPACLGPDSLQARTASWYAHQPTIRGVAKTAPISSVATRRVDWPIPLVTHCVLPSGPRMALGALASLGGDWARKAAGNPDNRHYRIREIVDLCGTLGTLGIK